MRKPYAGLKNTKGNIIPACEIGRSHKWSCPMNKGEWKRKTKITRDPWRIFYSVIKRRADKDTKGSGAKVGTAYHWSILAHQRVEKLNGNDYSTYYQWD